MKTESARDSWQLFFESISISEFVGQQISDIVNYSVSPSASGTSHESQFDRWPVKFEKSNVFRYVAEPRVRS